MSETATFTGDGFKPFPNTYEDNKHIDEVSSWSDERLENKVLEYWKFLSRDDIQTRARSNAERVLERLGFEIDWRAGFYEGDGHE